MSDNAQNNTTSSRFWVSDDFFVKSDDVSVMENDFKKNFPHRNITVCQNHTYSDDGTKEQVFLQEQCTEKEPVPSDHIINNTFVSLLQKYICDDEIVGIGELKFVADKNCPHNKELLRSKMYISNKGVISYENDILVTKR